MIPVPRQNLFFNFFLNEQFYDFPSRGEILPWREVDEIKSFLCRKKVSEQIVKHKNYLIDTQARVKGRFWRLIKRGDCVAQERYSSGRTPACDGISGFIVVV